MWHRDEVMTEILIYLATHMTFLFEPGGFRFVDSRVDPSFGGDAVVVLESEILRIRITWDRAQLLLSIHPLEGRSNEWFSPGLLRGLLQGDRGGSEVLDADWAAFLSAAIPELESRLDEPTSEAETLAELRRQAQLRSKELFG